MSASIKVGEFSWLKKSLEKLEEFKTLKPNWDSYGAKSINFDLISKTRDLLNSINMVDVPEPFLAPVSDGGVNIEWDTPNRYLSVKVRSEGVRFFGVKRDEDEKKEKDSGNIKENEENTAENEENFVTVEKEEEVAATEKKETKEKKAKKV